MNIAVTLHTSEHRGDHAADVEIAFDAIGAETVSELCDRVLGTSVNDERRGRGDFITIRRSYAGGDDFGRVSR